MKRWIAAGWLFASVIASNLCVQLVYASDSDVTAATNKTNSTAKWLSSMYVGAGFQNAFINVSAEAVTPYGHMYTKLGEFYGGDGIAAQIGFRQPYLLTGDEGKDQDGYYFGGFVGHVDSLEYFVPIVNSDNVTKYKSKHANRLGLGAEMSYVWQNKQRLNVASVSLAVARDTTAGSGANQVTATTEPMIMFGYSFQVNLF